LFIACSTCIRVLWLYFLSLLATCCKYIAQSSGISFWGNSFLAADSLGISGASSNFASSSSLSHSFFFCLGSGAVDGIFSTTVDSFRDLSSISRSSKFDRSCWEFEFEEDLSISCSPFLLLFFWKFNFYVLFTRRFRVVFKLSYFLIWLIIFHLDAINSRRMVSVSREFEKYGIFHIA